MEGPTPELHQRLGERVRDAWSALRRAEATGDQYGVDVHAAELADLRRIAAANGVSMEQAWPEDRSA